MADRNALARATEQSSSPTPGYLYNDIAKQSATSPSISAEILSYLMRRLAKNNAHVKYKVLKVISMVCENPNSRGVFKRTIVQDTQAIKDIKDCLNYRGKPDPVHGDQLSEKVRAQAKETLDAVYSDEPSSSQMNSMSSSGFGSGGGMGSGGYGGAASSGGYGGYSGAASSNSGNVGGGPKKMEGIGNPMFKDPRLEQSTSKGIGEMTIGDVASAAVEGFRGIIKDPLARNIPGANNSHGRPNIVGGGYGGPSGGWNSAPPGQAQLASATNGQWTMASNRGPTAISSETYKSGSNNVASGIGGSWGPSSSGPSVAAQSRMAANGPPTNHIPVVNITGHPGEANMSGTHEKNLIMELCPPGGMKPEPPADKLANFCRSLPDLNSDLICPALLDLLEDGQPWIIRAKVLCVMEKCVEVGDEMAKTSGNNVYADFFHMCHEEITPLASHARAAVREPAKRVCRKLGLDIPAFASTPAPSRPSASVSATAAVQPSQPAVEASDLLDFGDEPEAPPAAQPDVPPPPAPTTAPPAPPVDNSNSSSSLFGGMTMKSTAPAPAVSASVPSAPAPQPSADADFFGVEEESSQSVPVTQSAPAQPSQDSLLGDMGVKSEQVAISEPAAPVPAPAPAASGFSFINSGSAPAPVQAPVEAPVPPKPAAASFDPLLSLGPAGSTTSAKPQGMPQMAMTPQMAMVMQQQQQQILMMQAQMQQMQMAGGNNAQRFPVQQRQASNGSMGVMGGMGGHGVATSFAFMDDPNKAKKDASNKKFDFIQDAMKSAK